MKKLFLKIIIWYVFKKYKNTLPTQSNVSNPKMDYYFMQDAVIWEDEGLLESHPKPGKVFGYAVNHRRYLIETSPQEATTQKPDKFNKQVFEMAKKYFPNWIGFDSARCSYNPELSDRIKRIRKVANWQFDKLMNED